MSDGHVESVRRAWATWIARDLDANLAELGAEIEWDMTHIRGWPEQRLYRGTEEVRRFYEEWLATWEEYESGVDEFVDAGDAVLVLCWQRGKPRGGAFVFMQFAQVVRFEQGTQQRVENYTDRAEAAAAAGLPGSSKSRQTLEIVRRFSAALASGKVPEDLLAPDFTMENVSTAVTNRTYIGAEGIREWFHDFFDVLDADARYEAEPTDIGDDYAIAKLNISGRGRVSGAPLELPHWGVLRIAGDRITHAIGYATRREALDAVGLNEPRDAGAD